MFRTSEEKWRRYKQIGRSRFVLTFGVLGWGVPTAILFSLIRGVLDGWDQLPSHLVFAFVLFPLMGIMVGRISWRRLERQHEIQPST